MGRRYYCEYCDKVFIDEIEGRKKHLNSAHHVKLRALHYDGFRDLRTILEEETAKIPCRRFLGNGFCQFDSSCKYGHYTQEQLWQMKQEILSSESLKAQAAVPDTPSIEPWLIKYNQQRSIDENDLTDTFWTYPEHLENRSDLPASMKKFEPEHFKNAEFNEWG